MPDDQPRESDLSEDRPPASGEKGKGDPTEPQPSVFSGMASPDLDPSLVLPSGLGFGIQVSPGPSQSDKFLDKMTSTHISKVIEQAGHDSRLDHEHRMWSMWLMAGITLIVMLLVFALCWLFLAYDEPALLEKSIALLVGLVSGGIGGFGAGRLTASRATQE